MNKTTSEIYIEKTKDHRDTLLHELSHFILGMITGNWFSHSKKFNKLYKFLKKL